MYNLRSTLPLVCLLVASTGCTTATELYCDAETPCENGARCDYERKTCVPNDAAIIPDKADAAPIPDIDKGLPNGESCSSPKECESAYCVDGVCCESACDGTCLSCALPGKAGSCSLVDDGQDPRKDCEGKDLTCGGTCDGGGQCRYADSDTDCGDKSCAAGELSFGKCDGAGACGSKKTSCGGYACESDGKTCKESCSGNGDCTGVFACIGTSCQASLPKGSACGTNNKACASGNCVDGVCCTASACGGCQRCDIAGSEGDCSAVADGTSCGAVSCTAGDLLTPECTSGSCGTSKQSCAPYTCNAAGTACAVKCSTSQDCVGNTYCAANKTCQPKKGNGVSCTAKEECTSGLCTQAEGVCCDRACGGECESCAGKSACTAKAAGTACGPADKCVDQNPTSFNTKTSFVEQHRCDGSSGICKKTNVTCDPYVCADATKCRTSCTAQTQCTSHICQLWSGTKNTCIPAAQICYASGYAATNGHGTKASPYSSIESCFVKNAAIISSDTADYDDIMLPGAAPETLIVGPPSIQPGVYNTSLNFADHTVTVFHGTLHIVNARINSDQPTAFSITNGKLLHLENCHVDTSVYNTTIIQSNNGNIKLENVNVTVPSGTSPAFVNMTNGGTLEASRVIVHDTTTAFSLHNVSSSYFSQTRILDADTAIRLTGSSSAFITNTLIAKSSSQAIKLSDTSSATIVNCTLAGNIVTGNAASVESSSSFKSEIWNSVIYPGSNASSVGGNVDTKYSLVRGSTPGTGNIVGVPGFTDATNGDYSLKSTSACIDAALDSVPAVTMPTVDLDGNPRKKKLLSKPNATDIGALERQTP